MIDIRELASRIFSKFPDLNQRQVAELLGLTESTVSCWKSGKSTPRLPELAKIVELTGISWDELLTGKRATPSPAPAGHTGDDPRAPLYRPGKNRFLNALHTMAEMEECARSVGGQLEEDWDIVLEDFRASVEEMMPAAQRERKQAEDQAQKSQAG